MADGELKRRNLGILDGGGVQSGGTQRRRLDRIQSQAIDLGLDEVARGGVRALCEAQSAAGDRVEMP